jgi:hypothetical protein
MPSGGYRISVIRAGSAAVRHFLGHTIRPPKVDYPNFPRQKSALESGFCEGSESPAGRLEKPPKNPIYSTTC